LDVDEDTLTKTHHLKMKKGGLILHDGDQSFNEYGLVLNNWVPYDLVFNITVDGGMGKRADSAL